MIFIRIGLILSTLSALIPNAVAQDACSKLYDPTAACPQLANPADQLLFTADAPNALDYTVDTTAGPVKITVKETKQWTGLRDCVLPGMCVSVPTPVWGYAAEGGLVTWPGPTLIAKTNIPSIVTFVNGLIPGVVHPMTSLNGDKSVVDTSLHWAYSLHGLQEEDIRTSGVPIVTHLHGGHSTPEADGYPEAFYTAGLATTGPDFKSNEHTYENDQPAGTLWYHDHTLGITRLNVYAGLAGFYLIRDEYDTGNKNRNPLNLPTGQFELAYAIQDRMFKKSGELFYPAYEDEPYYQDFITDEEADPPQGSATALAEFFGDFMLVNGVLWPRKAVYPRKYRIRLLNGCDSRFLVTKFVKVQGGSTTYSTTDKLLDYTIIGTDQGLLREPIEVKSSVIETGGRLDLVIDFSTLMPGERVILQNQGGDEPFRGIDQVSPQTFEHTDKIMAFDVVAIPKGLQNQLEGDDSPNLKEWPGAQTYSEADVSRRRRVGLFEGRDELNRLQPLLGGELSAGSIKTLIWDDAATEKPDLNAVEDWEIYNFSGDAHPIHLHLVHFEVIGRYEIIYHSQTTDGIMNDESKCPASDQLGGICIDPINIMQHNGNDGTGFKAIFPTEAPPYDSATPLDVGEEYSSEKGGRKDTVTALPNQVTVIRAKFDKQGKFVWHCHILSHEDHEMMRDFCVGHC